MPDDSSQILIFGCGNMGSAILRGWLAAGFEPQRFVVVDPAVRDLPPDVAHYSSAKDIDRQFETLLLGIKPQMLASLAPDIAQLLAPDALLVSILAGLETMTLAKHFARTRIVRLMPNLAAAIGKSPLGLFASDLGADEREQLEALFAPLGTPIWLDDEAQMDAVTALAGSGPAFVYRFIDALAQGGVEAGLPTDVAARLALSMVDGAALLAAGSSESPTQLAARVTSPGGTTAAGLAILDNNDSLIRLIAATLSAARDRGVELARGEMT